MIANHTHPERSATACTLVHLGLDYSELLEVLLVCMPVRPGGCAPWLFREFLIRGLADEAPRLAFKLGMLDDDQMISLCHFIEAVHGLTDHPDVVVVPERLRRRAR
jgi:hypothetical protein